MGKYFVKAVLKEYAFNPDQQIVSLDEGQKLKISIKARRVEYSIFGKMKMFGLKKLKEIDVEAVSEDVDVHGEKHVESAIIENNNEFVIKGLKPGKTYNISVMNSQHIIAIPSSHQVLMKKQDLFNVEFVLAEKWRTVSLSGMIEFSDKWTSTEIKSAYPLKVSIQEKVDESTLSGENIPVEYNQQRISRYNYFEFLNLKNTQYMVNIYANESNVPMLTQTIDLTNTKPGVLDAGSFLVDKEGQESLRNEKAISFGPVLIITMFIYFMGKETFDGMISAYMKK